MTSNRIYLYDTESRDIWKAKISNYDGLDEDVYSLSNEPTTNDDGVLWYESLLIEDNGYSLVRSKPDHIKIGEYAGKISIENVADRFSKDIGREFVIISINGEVVAEYDTGNLVGLRGVPLRQNTLIKTTSDDKKMVHDD